MGLDIEALRNPDFIRQIQARIGDLDNFKARPLKLVPAPKNQRWAYLNGEWSPQETNIDKKLRPLAHVDLQDQVIATAMMLCLADRVENRLGKPRISVAKEQNRKRTLAYGHRLFCDGEGNTPLRHRWGSSKLYRSFFQDYQTFLERPKVVAKDLRTRNGDGETLWLRPRLCEQAGSAAGLVEKGVVCWLHADRGLPLAGPIRMFGEGPEVPAGRTK